jgi:ATP dependent DNA ligase C terminal region/ATP dependent DNA ligase domain
MASKLLSDNPLTKRAIKWKHDQAIISLTFDELKKKIKGKEFIAEQKIDGQSAIMEYKDGRARFGSLGGRIITDIPVLSEIEAILKKQDVKSALMVGELAGFEKGKVIHFDKTESLIKNPVKEKDTLHWFPYQLLEINGEKYGEEFDVYKKTWPQIVKLFAGAKHIQPVKSETDDLQKAWDTYVEKEGNEGIVVRTEKHIYKAKPEYYFDLVIVAVGSKKGKNWPKKMIGNTLMAFMDKDKVFRIAGEVGTGWSDAESKELFSWAQKNKIGEDDTYVWVKPEKIMEIQYERSNIRLTKCYKYEKGEYVKVDDKPVGTIVKPRFIRYRTDKSVNPKDLRLTQIPDWEKRSRVIEKMARRVARNFMSSDIREKECLQDLLRVGPHKPLGYLPIETVEKWIPDFYEFKNSLKDKGLEVIVLSHAESNVGSGALVAYDKSALKAVLDKNKDILQREGWPFDPDKFVLYHFQHVAYRDKDPELFNIIADCYADNRNKVKTASIKENVEEASKTSKPSVFLGGYCKNNKWREDLKKQFGKDLFFIDPYDKDWKPEENIYDELSGLMIADYRIFYKGGEGSEKEEKFLEYTDKDFIICNNSDDLKSALNMILTKEDKKKANKVVAAYLQRI